MKYTGWCAGVRATLTSRASEAAGQEVALPPAAAEEALEVGEVRRAYIVAMVREVMHAPSLMHRPVYFPIV